jgi:hypothetical protein
MVAQQIEIEGTERNYPPGIKKKLKKTQASRAEKIEAGKTFRRDEADLIEEMKKEKIKLVVDDSTDPPYVLELTAKDSIKRRPWKPKKKSDEGED